MTTSNSLKNDGQIEALARDKVQLAKEVTVIQAEFQAVVPRSWG